MLRDQAHSTFLEAADGLAGLRVSIYVAVKRVRRVLVDPCNLQGATVGPCRMAVRRCEKYSVLWCELIENVLARFGSRTERRHGPATARYPFALASIGDAIRHDTSIVFDGLFCTQVATQCFKT